MVLGYNFAVKMPSYSLPGHVVSQSCKNATSDRGNKYLESLDQRRDDNLIRHKPDKKHNEIYSTTRHHSHHTPRARGLTVQLSV